MVATVSFAQSSRPKTANLTTRSRKNEALDFVDEAKLSHQQEPAASGVKRHRVGRAAGAHSFRLGPKRKSRHTLEGGLFWPVEQNIQRPTRGMWPTWVRYAQQSGHRRDGLIMVTCGPARCRQRDFPCCGGHVDRLG